MTVIIFRQTNKAKNDTRKLELNHINLLNCCTTKFLSCISYKSVEHPVSDRRNSVLLILWLSLTIICQKRAQMNSYTELCYDVYLLRVKLFNRKFSNLKVTHTKNTQCSLFFTVYCSRHHILKNILLSTIVVFYLFLRCIIIQLVRFTQSCLLDSHVRPSGWNVSKSTGTS